MGVRVTTTEKVAALYDSVTGFAFGPVFDDEFEAEEFLAWFIETYAGDDLRVYGHEEVAGFVREWREAIQGARDES